MSKFINETGFLEDLEEHVSLIIDFSKAFSIENGTLESLLIDAGLSPEITDIILAGYININRV